MNEENALDTRDFLTKRLEAVKNSRSAGDFEELALVIGETGLRFARSSLLTHSCCRIDGKSLSFALEKDLSKTFLELAVMCKAVVCCESVFDHDSASPLIFALFRSSLSPSEGSCRQTRQEEPESNLARDRRRSQRREHDPSGSRRRRHFRSRRAASREICRRGHQSISLSQEAPARPRHLELSATEQAHSILVLQEHRPVHDWILGELGTPLHPLSCCRELIRERTARDSSHSKTRSPDKFSRKVGPSRSTTSCSLSYPRSFSAYSISLSGPGCSTGTRSYTNSGNRTNSCAQSLPIWDPRPTLTDHVEPLMSTVQRHNLLAVDRQRSRPFFRKCSPGHSFSASSDHGRSGYV